MQSPIKGALSGLKRFLATESPLKMMKTAFYFTLKSLFVLRYLNFCLDFRSCMTHDRNVWRRNLGNKQLQCIYCQISMKFGQLIEYNTRNIFLEKSHTKCCGETIPRPFSNKSNLSISLDLWSKVLSSLFLFYAKSRAIEIY